MARGHDSSQRIQATKAWRKPAEQKQGRARDGRASLEADGGQAEGRGKDQEGGPVYLGSLLFARVSLGFLGRGGWGKQSFQRPWPAPPAAPCVCLKTLFNKDSHSAMCIFNRLGPQRVARVRSLAQGQYQHTAGQEQQTHIGLQAIPNRLPHTRQTSPTRRPKATPGHPLLIKLAWPEGKVYSPSLMCPLAYHPHVTLVRPEVGKVFLKGHMVNILGAKGYTRSVSQILNSATEA